jgi:hypothetical protein
MPNLRKTKIKIEIPPNEIPPKAQVFSYLAQSIALMTLIKPWSSCGLILGSNNLESAQVSWIRPLSASLNLLALALVIGPTGTCNGSLGAAPLFSSL